MKKHRMRENHCPTCRVKLDGASSFETDEAPKAGDVTICIECGEILSFGDDLTLHKALPAEFDDLELETRATLNSMRFSIRQKAKQRGGA